MSLSLLTNVASLEAQRNVNQTQSLLQQSVERLSSGLRITHASDDAAGLAISSKLSAELRGIKQASRNANDAISMIQTAEGGLAQVNGLLARMRELAVQAANGGTLGDSERSSVDTEFQALQDEIDRIINVTTYNGQVLLNGDCSSVAFQVGAYNTGNDQLAISISATSSSSLSIGSSTVSTMSTARSAIQALDTAINTIAGQRATVGAIQNRVTAAVDNLSSAYTNLSAANSRIMDVDVAEESATMTRSNILLQAGVSVLAQANSQPQIALQLLRS